MNVRKELFKNQDLVYKEFHKKLIPDFDEDKVIGVRVPILRKIAKKCASNNITFIPEYHEELMVYGLMIGYSKCDINDYIIKLDAFVPKISTWAICDTACSNLKFTKKYPTAMWDYINKYYDGSEYEVRFMIVMMMTYYLNDDYIDDVLNILTSISREEYYIKMAVAWALATALVNYEDKVKSILETKTLDKWTHNKTIQKAKESYRISRDTKDYLNNMKIK